MTTSHACKQPTSLSAISIIVNRSYSEKSRSEMMPCGLKEFIGLVLVVSHSVLCIPEAHKWTKREVLPTLIDKPRERPILVKELGNYEPKNVEKRVGPGEYGEAYNLPEEKRNAAEESEMEYGMNIACSNEISLDRAVKDTRLPECKHWNYAADLPSTSVIIVFHNEGWSVLLRTVHSVLNRSPAHILHEILLVDDFSDKEDLKDKLTNYLERFNGKVRLIRNSEREGLIRTRSRGAKEATGEVIVFLEAHCEVNTNWLPPLLAPIYSDRTVMAVPVIDGIDLKTFEYRSVYGDNYHYRGIFEWGMLYKENEVPYREQRRREHNSEPYKSPTHSGASFAINREFFLELGAYDPGLSERCGANFEQSFKIWQCGGSIEWVPCSRVGYIYKLTPENVGTPTETNYKRIVETWFDDKYKEYFYARLPLVRYLDMGNISEQVLLKENLQCKSFQWYMDNVAYEVFDRLPPPPANLHYGELRSVATEKCLDTMGREAVSCMGLEHCHGHEKNQLLRLNVEGQLGIGDSCVEGDRQLLKLAFCRLGTVDGPWQYDEKSKTISHRIQKKCLAVHPQTHKMSLQSCDINDVYQKWIFRTILPPRARDNYKLIYGYLIVLTKSLYITSKRTNES